MSVGMKGLSPNPIQRFMVDHPGAVPFYRAGYLVGPLGLFVAKPGRVGLAVMLFAIGLFVLILLSAFSPSRKQTRKQRWETLGVILPWPKTWPGWRGSEELLAEESQRGPK